MPDWQVLNFGIIFSCAGNTYPVDVCLENPELLSIESCAYTFPLDVCIENTFLFAQVQCSDLLTPELCATTPPLTLTPECAGPLDGYQPSLFECVDNKEPLCGLGLCEKHQFIVKC